MESISCGQRDKFGNCVRRPVPMMSASYQHPPNTKQERERERENTKRREVATKQKKRGRAKTNRKKSKHSLICRCHKRHIIYIPLIHLQIIMREQHQLRALRCNLSNPVCIYCAWSQFSLGGTAAPIVRGARVVFTRACGHYWRKESEGRRGEEEEWKRKGRASQSVLTR